MSFRRVLEASSFGASPSPSSCHDAGLSGSSEDRNGFNAGLWERGSLTFATAVGFSRQKAPNKRSPPPLELCRYAQQTNRRPPAPEISRRQGGRNLLTRASAGHGWHKLPT
ncbi:hypothetical protein AAFF_G00107400 [Aldrovandia affinis]|uniref:Uncharacterized protein n=1 Tax=Aldrovandia affinis TaxID=143900 RepID=A0AAD7RTY8_9TELE|nr:hypothetical protein AAFF_G00107400 [Aldrovandia affinis]